MGKHTRKWKRSCMNVINTDHGSITVQQDCHPDDAFDRDVRERLENETKFVMDACNALANIPDPAAYIKAMRVISEAAIEWYTCRSEPQRAKALAELFIAVKEHGLSVPPTPESEVK